MKFKFNIKNRHIVVTILFFSMHLNLYLLPPTTLFCTYVYHCERGSLKMLQHPINTCSMAPFSGRSNFCALSLFWQSEIFYIGCTYLNPILIRPVHSSILVLNHLLLFLSPVSVHGGLLRQRSLSDRDRNQRDLLQQEGLSGQRRGPSWQLRIRLWGLLSR